MEKQRLERLHPGWAVVGLSVTELDPGLIGEVERELISSQVSLRISLVLLFPILLLWEDLRTMPSRGALILLYILVRSCNGWF